ncbi:MAG: zinc-finger domain-containing protein [Geminicoccaceae bacterium]
MNKVIEDVKVDSKTVSCDGGAGQLGHPRVFLAIDDTNQVTCPYCGQIFVLDPAKAETGH